MLTKVDIKTLKEIVDTKQEAERRHKETLKRFDGVDRRISFVEKNVSTVERKVDELTDFIVPAVGNILKWTDDIHRAIVGKPMKSSHGN